MFLGDQEIEVIITDSYNNQHLKKAITDSICYIIIFQ